jgi:DNA-binding HxlR family transcriptional regulator
MKRTMNETHDMNCSVAATAEIVATKWTPLIIHDLSEGARRFMQLEHACPGISPRTLSERLDMLERQGVLVRRSYPESPPRVEYELTEKGRALLPIIREMRRFGRAWMVAETPKRRRTPAVRR